MEDRYPNLIAYLRAACEALPDNDALKDRLAELTHTHPLLVLVEPSPQPLYA